MVAYPISHSPSEGQEGQGRVWKSGEGRGKYQPSLKKNQLNHTMKPLEKRDE